jgi:hypothetical protein
MTGTTSAPRATDSVPAAPAPHTLLWWCGSCRRAEPFTDSDLERYSREGWPRCCGRLPYCFFGPPQSKEK